MKEKTNSRSKAKRVLYMALLSLATVGATLVARHPIQAPYDEGGAEAAIRPEAKRRASNADDEPLCGSEAPDDEPSPTPYDGYGAETADYFEQPGFAAEYFANLTEHFPTNNANNCGYVAAAMLLSYYDTYWNGSIIPNWFNNPMASRVHLDDSHYSSPGVNDFYAPVWTERNPRMDPPEDGDNDSEYARRYYENEREAYHEYLDRMLAYTNDNIVSELYSIALDPAVGAYRFDIEPKPLLNVVRMQTVVNHFLAKNGLQGKIEMNAIKLLDFNNVTEKEEYQRELLRKEAISALKEGRPIVLSGKLSKYKYKDGIDGGGNSTSTSFHAVIAYGLDEDYHIIGHMGWKGRDDYSRAILDKEFEYFTGFAYLDISPELEFTPGNYRFYDHGFLNATDLPSHIHGNRVVIDYGDSFFHVRQCICGDFYYEPHTEAIEQVDDQFHRVYCEKCGHEEVAAHRIIPIHDVGWYCADCGAMFTYSHPPVITPWNPSHD